MCDERPSLHIKFERPSCWLELLRRLATIGKKLSYVKGRVSILSSIQNSVLC